MTYIAFPANTIHRLDVGLMLGQRRRRCPNIKPTLGQRVFRAVCEMGYLLRCRGSGPVVTGLLQAVRDPKHILQPTPGPILPSQCPTSETNNTRSCSIQHCGIFMQTQETNVFFQFEIIINVLVSSSRYF